ncbi:MULTISPECIES: FAD-binding protein [Bacillus cereus group]|uniref:FAD-binding protein n=1 Tax=Bacillus cereus group TaxID=86661 RepID=UPI001F3EE95F|nr:FAD-binding protein [Bacillus mycoides]
MKKFDVAIVGGGLAGLTASIYLAKERRKESCCIRKIKQKFVVRMMKYLKLMQLS